MGEDYDEPADELPGEAYARITDPGTSHEAADSVEGEKATAMEKVVLELLTLAGETGMTNHELVEQSGISWNTITPRVRPLVRKGLVADSLVRRQGPTGRRCIVWIRT